MKSFYWTIVILLVVSAAGRLWIDVQTHSQYATFRDASQLVTARGQVHQLLSAWDSRQLQASGSTLQPSSMRDLPSPLSKVWSSLSRAGVTQIRFQRFDPAAVVIVRPGADKQPGVAGIDDRPNGIVDDASELGATGSDDICRAEPASQSLAEPGQLTLILQRGAYIPATGEAAAHGKHPNRAIVIGNYPGGETWSFMVERSAKIRLAE